MTSKMRKMAGLKDKKESVKVIVRVRPLNKKERANGNRVAVNIDSESASVSALDPSNAKGVPKDFTFDRTYGSKSRQQDIYDQIAAPVVEDVLKGFNGTIFAYGQTGAGKTFTMEGIAENPELRGIIPRSFRHIFDKIAVSEKGGEKKFLVRASYLEIYNEEIRDLLSRNSTRRLDVKEDVDGGVYVEDLTSQVVKSVVEISDVLKAGKKNRSVGATAMNQTSSRSHSIFTVVVETSDVGVDGKPHFTVGKLNLVDLAGSERQSKTHAEGQRFKEATKINLSLSALGNVISALVDGKTQHVPYRDSKLTRLLQDSLGGNTKTVMCANCGPADYNYEETLSTLRYANRAKQIKNKPKINEDPKDAMLREFQEEIMRLRKAIRDKRGGGGAGDGDGSKWSDDDDDDVVVREKIIVRKEGVDREIYERLKNKSREEQEKILREVEERKRELALKNARTAKEREELEKKLELEKKKKAKRIAERRALQEKLANMEKKVLLGGEALDRAAAQARELKRKKIELRERKLAEERMARQLAAQEEDFMMLQEDFASLQEEASVKTQKLRKLYAKYQQQKAEVKDIEAEFNREREGILQDVRALNKELKYKQFILDRYVPEFHLKRIEEWATFDEVSSSWTIKRIEFSGNKASTRHDAARRKKRRDNAAATLPQYNPFYQYDKHSEEGVILERKSGKKEKRRGRRSAHSSRRRKDGRAGKRRGK